jgi:predicted metalloprotease with PDZ domain
MRHCITIGALVAALGAPPAARAQSHAPFRAEYTVEVRDTAAHLFHVTATFSNLRQPRLDVALPIWTPGWYTLEYYAKNIRRFVVTDGAGTRLAAPLSRAQTWTIDTRGRTRVVVEFDYVANVLALNQAKITGTYAFFTGTQLFLEPVGHRDATSLVRFVAPSGWRIATALTETSDSAVYTAPDYDALVDAPTWLGAFESVPFDVDGKPHFFVFGAGSHFSADTMRWQTEQLATVVRTAAAIFGGLPYDKYLFFQLPDTAESDAAGALEHGNSFVGCCGPADLGADRYTAHEFFHLWNVKRIRPAELWPYDYARPVETPSLWVSEGVSEYYGGLIAYRAGLQTDTAFIGALRLTMTSIASKEERLFVSPSDASMATWRGYLHEPVSYYRTGEILGALLDLSIIRDTQGRRGLDDVMRLLYHQFFRRNRGFTPDDLARTVSSIAGRDYTDFFRRYVAGLDTLPFDSILGYAGVRAIPYTGTQLWSVFVGYSTPVAAGRRIETLFPRVVATADLRVGDVMVAVDDTPIDRVRFLYPSGGALLTQKVHQRVVITVLRDSSRIQVPVTLVPFQSVKPGIAYDSTATEGQLAVRRRWLARSE